MVLLLLLFCFDQMIKDLTGGNTGIAPQAFALGCHGDFVGMNIPFFRNVHGVWTEGNMTAFLLVTGSCCMASGILRQGGL